MPDYPVVQPPAPNLAPSYEVIQQALAQRAQTAKETPPSPLGNAAKLVGTAAGAYAGHEFSEAEEKHLIDFKAHAEEQLQKDVATFKAPLEGRTPVTQDRIDKPFLDQGMTPEQVKKYAPQLDPKAPIKYMTDAEAATESQRLLRSYNTETMAKSIEANASSIEKTNPTEAASLRTKAAALRIVGPTERGDAYIALLAGVSKPKFVTNPITGLTDVRDSVSGQVVVPSVENLDTTKVPEVDDWKKLNPKDKTAGTALVKDLVTNNPEIKKVNSHINVLNTLQDMVDTGKDNPNAVTNIRTQLGIDVGGVSAGKMNASLFQNEGYSKSIADKLVQAVTTGLEGTFTAKNLQGIQDQLTNDEKHFQDQHEQLLGGAAGGLAASVHLTPEAARKYIDSISGATVAPPKAKPKPVEEKVPVKGPNGETGKANKGQKLPEGWHFIVP